MRSAGCDDRAAGDGACEWILAAMSTAGTATRLEATCVSKRRRLRVRVRADEATSACEVSSIDGANDVCCGVEAERVPRSVGMSTVANGAVNGNAVRISRRLASVFRSMKVSRFRLSKIGASRRSSRSTEEP